MSNRQLTDAECEERRVKDRERLKQAAEQLLTSEGWQRWMRVRAQGGLVAALAQQPAFGRAGHT